MVSETVKTEWNNVFKMNIVEFLNLLCFTKDFNKEQERMYKEAFKTKR